MILVLDVGNTSTTVGLYNGEELVHHFRIPSDRDKTVKEFQEELDVNLGSVNIEGAIIGSVVEEINDRLCYAIQYLYKVQPVLLSSTSISYKYSVCSFSERYLFFSSFILNYYPPHNYYKIINFFMRISKYFITKII